MAQWACAGLRADLVCAASRLELLLLGRRSRQARAQPSIAITGMMWSLLIHSYCMLWACTARPGLVRRADVKSVGDQVASSSWAVPGSGSRCVRAAPVIWLCPNGVVIGPQKQLGGSATRGAAEEDLGQGSQSLRHCNTAAAPTVLPSPLAVAVESNNAQTLLFSSAGLNRTGGRRRWTAWRAGPSCHEAGVHFCME